MSNENLMNNPDEADFYRQLRQELVSYLIKNGRSRPDTEDRVQTALMEVFARGDRVGNPRAYAYTVIRRERPRRELPTGVGWPGGPEPAEAAGDGPGSGITLRECLTVLSDRPQQEKIVSMAFDGWRNAEIARKLDLTPATVRSHRRHARRTVRGWWGDDGDDLRRLAVGHSVYEAFLSGAETLPVAPRPMIRQAWDQAVALGVDPEHGRPQEPLGDDELKHRRERFLRAVDGIPWVLARLADLATETGQMMVLADQHGVVLWRGGDSTIIKKADQAAFVDGARWDISHAGPGGIALALGYRRLVRVCRFEHFVQQQHGLSCVAAPVCEARNGRVSMVLNLTGTSTTVPPAIARELDSIALRLRLQG